MQRRRLRLASGPLIGCALLACLILQGQTSDRISSFNSEITVDKDRTVHVHEKLQITNNGFFDRGFHRRLEIRPANRGRLREGSYQPRVATIDGQTALVRAGEDSGEFDIAIVPHDGALSRGDHAIEVIYDAKYQFAIYRDYEDFNQSVTGEWPLTVEKAAVVLSLPAGLPKKAGISADTGTRSRFKFDCTRTDLPNGIRFETTHPLSPGNDLFLSSRFPHPGYFVSDYKEDGYRALLQNYPLLVPIAVSSLGSVAMAAIGFIVWGRAPHRAASLSDASIANFTPPFWREVVRTYGFPIVMFGLAFVPGANFLAYSGHGGVGWLLLPLCLPWVIVRILIKIAKGSEQSSNWYKSFFKLTVPSYLVLALPLSWAAVTSIHSSMGLAVSPWVFFALAAAPFPWVYFM
jgi:hypothetical protein